MKEQIVEYINKLGQFCGKRDVETLTPDCLQKKYGVEQADVMVLFGGSIISGGDILAKAMLNKIAQKYIIVGGEGHTTESLRQRVHTEFPAIMTEGLPEAEIFNYYLGYKYGLKADLLETESTNCGNNITNLLDLLKQNRIHFKRIIICQDATMQHRMDVGLRKYISDDVVIINYAVYKAELIVRNEKIEYISKIDGMWNIERYVNLLMGEIPRLADKEDGYGPKGKNYIAHVDIPKEVQHAFEELKKVYGDNTREANPLYASMSMKSISS